MINEIKQEYQVPFTQISNDVINDPNLSWGAKGLFSYLASKPTGWKFYCKEITSHSTDTNHKMAKYLKELELAGLVKRKKFNVKGEHSTIQWQWCILNFHDIVKSRQSCFTTLVNHDNREKGAYNNTETTTNTETTNNTDYTKTTETKNPSEQPNSSAVVSSSVCSADVVRGNGESKGGGRRRRRPLVKPTIDEVKKFCEVEGLNLVDAYKFWKYYEDWEWTWYDSKSGSRKPLENWKRAVRGWQDREEKRIKEQSEKNKLSKVYIDPEYSWEKANL